MQVGRRAPLELGHPARAFWLVVVGTFIGDQVTKAFVRVLWSSAQLHHPLDALLSGFIGAAHSAQESVPIIGSVLRLTFVLNTGAAFGLLAGYRPIFILTSMVVLLAVGAYWRIERPKALLVVIGSALITSGALGNLVDRALFGRVTDFLDVSVLEFPVFNLADSWIVIGVGILMVWLLFGPQESESSKANDIEIGPAAESPGEGS